MPTDADRSWSFSALKEIIIVIAEETCPRRKRHVVKVVKKEK